MRNETFTTEQRKGERHLTKNNIFIDMKTIPSVSVAEMRDMSTGGVCCIARDHGNYTPGSKVTMDIVSNNKTIIRSIISEIIYVIPELSKENVDEYVYKIGLRFVLLSDLNKLLFEKILTDNRYFK